MPEPIRSLPPHPSLEQQKKLAKELLRSYRAGDADAVARVRAQLPDRAEVTLADAQFVLAREYGFRSWARLKSHLEAAADAASAERLREDFRRAVHNRNASGLQKLFERYPAARMFVNEPMFSFDSPALVHIAGSNDPELIDVLLDSGADPNRRSDWWAGGFHVLHSARGAIADRLIEAGAVPDACAAASLDRPTLLRSLLDADPSCVHERGGDGQTPLHFARSREVIDLLLERGADPDARDLDHRATPAQWMLDRRRGAGRYELAAYLVERGATADIFLAAALGLTDRLHELLDADPGLLLQRTHQGEYGEKPPSSYHIYTWTIGQNLSPLEVAAQFGQHDALVLMQSFAGPRLRFVDACARGDAATARALLRERPGLVEELTLQNQRALADAAWADRPAAVELMLELGFDPSVRSENGGTVLHCGAWAGSVACVQIALRFPAARSLVNVLDDRYSSTPLGWCCHGAQHCGNPRADHRGVARVLLEAGAQPPQSLDGVRPDVAAVIRGFAGG